MTSENAALIRDSRALVRESMHVKRASGWIDVTEQLTRALERSEEIRESLEAKVQELAAQLERARAPSSKSRLQPLPYLDDEDA